MSNNNLNNEHIGEDSSSSEDQPRMRRQRFQRIITQNPEANELVFDIVPVMPSAPISQEAVQRQQADEEADGPEERQDEVEQPEGQPEEQPEGQPERQPEEHPDEPEIIDIEDSQPLPALLSPPTTSRRARQQNVIELDTPQPKKRKRLSTSKETTPKSPKSKSPKAGSNDDEDDGLTCPICLDSWEMTGDHRLVSLKCGHLFGECCIRRWLSESQRQSSVKVCPQCKATTAFRDIRHLYAKRVQVLDTSLKEELETERRKSLALTSELATVKLSHKLTSDKLFALQLDYDHLKKLMPAGGGSGGHGAFSNDLDPKSVQSLANYRLYMEKNFDLCRDPGCRVLLHSQQHHILMATQKSAQNLFPGFGIRFIDTPTFRPLNFMQTSALIIRDMAFSESQRMVTVASRERKIKLFDVRSYLCSAMFAAHERNLWSCALDRNEREHFIYSGDLRGSVYIYDLRFPTSILSEFQPDENFTPVIHIATVPSGKTFPGGGFLVCQLTALTFYEYAQESGAAIPTRLNIDGPFTSMNYDPIQHVLLLSVRENIYPQSRFILAKLDKIGNTPVIMIRTTINSSKTTPVMIRPTQMAVENNTLIVSYHQDAKQLIMHDVRREKRVQTMAVNELIYDICPVITGQSDHYLAALSDTKCRIYKVTTTR